MGSNVDLVLLSGEERLYTRGEDWLVLLGRRALTSSGLHVELGVAPPSWASTERLDPGTRRVVSDGMSILYDPDDLLTELAVACGRYPEGPPLPLYTLPESTVAAWMTGLRAGPKGGA